MRMAGALPSGEVWSTGVHGASNLDIDAVKTAWQSAVTALWAGTGSSGIHDLYSTTVTCNRITVYTIDGTTGKASDAREAALTSGGGSPEIALPQEVAVCLTLRTGKPGPKNRGRMFFPPMIVSAVQASGRLGSVQAATLVGGMTVALQSLATAQVAPILFTHGQANRNITFVDCGDVFDAQRRRRDKLVEARVQGGAITVPI